MTAFAPTSGGLRFVLHRPTVLGAISLDCSPF